MQSLILEGGACPMRRRELGFGLVWLALLGGFSFQGGPAIFAQSPASIHGHVYHSEGHAPCGDAWIQAWPCGASFAAQPDGRFDAHCPQGIDSVTVMAHGHRVVTQAVHGRTHVDIELECLSVSLEDAEVVDRSSEFVEGTVSMKEGDDLLVLLDREAGVRSLDLGAGMVQPVLRGLTGSRVAVLEDGVPQVGGRWAADHGVLLDPALYDGTEWVPGGGQVWLSPEAMGGGLRLRPLAMLSASGSRTQSSLSHRAGDARSRFSVVHRQRSGAVQWHAGLSQTRFGDRNVPQESFTYIGRLIEIEEGRLANTAGHGGHGLLGMRWIHPEQGQFSVDFRASEVLQGLFPGIIGVPSQSDLRGDGDRFSVDIPHQRARRVQLASKWVHPGALDRIIRFSLSRNERIESAPPHAHGYGPEPDDDLSLALDERHAFFESRWEGIHGAFGMQAEHLEGQTSGWEFLLPDHRRSRWSLVVDQRRQAWRIGARLDVVKVTNAGHVEPLYASDGSVTGDDVRARALNRTMFGWAIHANRPFRWGAAFEGDVVATLYARVPDSYALSANGIHHGTFRFEQGNPNLNPERTAEVRFNLTTSGHHREERKLNASLRSFVALHQRFIHLSPSARFAPIAHAGQVYTFEALDAFRTGGEFEADWAVGGGRLSASLALLGQWALETGLGLPFTAPTQLQTGYRWPATSRAFVRPRFRRVAAANLTARNEKPTPGASLWGVELGIQGERMALTLDMDNVFNAAWLDHVSAYRALGLVTQGRWASLRFTVDVTRPNDRP